MRDARRLRRRVKTRRAGLERYGSLIVMPDSAAFFPPQKMLLFHTEGAARFGITTYSRRAFFFICAPTYELCQRQHFRVRRCTRIYFSGVLLRSRRCMRTRARHVSPPRREQRRQLPPLE